MAAGAGAAATAGAAAQVMALQRLTPLAEPQYLIQPARHACLRVPPARGLPVGLPLFSHPRLQAQRRQPRHHVLQEEILVDVLYRIVLLLMKGGIDSHSYLGFAE